jgi:uncharacterized protein YjbI with pentapeptide repeats
MRKVKARNLIRQLTQDPDKMVSRLRMRSRPLLPLCNATIVDRFDLSNHTIKKPISFQDCVFKGVVDLRYSEFERNVEFTGCTFHQEFKGGTYKKPRAVYRKDLNCSESSFRSTATFIGIQVGNSGYFDDCRFESEEPKGTDKSTVDFTGAAFGSNIECINTMFRGPVSFNTLRCGDRGVFERAQFGSERKSVSVDFTGASFGRNIECVNTEFNGPVRMNGLKCDDRGNFRNAKFGERVNLLSTSFGSHLVCTGAKFKGPAIFNGLKCDGIGYFNRSEFELEEPKGTDESTVDFTGASFGSHLLCVGAKFKGPASFNSLRCNGSGHFDHTKFAQSVEFRLATFGLILRCPEAEFGGQVDASWVKCDYECSFERAVFEGKVSFRGLHCGKTGNFKGTTFAGDEVDFRHSHFEVDLDLRGAYFAGKVILGQASVLNKLCLGAAYFSGDAELYGSDIKILELMDANYVPKGYPPSFEVRTSKEQEGFDSVVRDRKELDNILNQGTNETTQRIVETCYPFVKGNSALIDDIFERNESIKRLVEAFFPFRKDSLTLIDTTFQRFHGGPNRELARKLALKLVQEQVPKRFSRDPYLQLEKYYAGIGEEDDAVKMHRRGHSALRENAKNYRSRHPDKTGTVKWSWYKIWVIDFALKHLTAYGTRAWLAVLYLLPLLVIGTIVFCGNHTLLTKGDLENVGPVSPGHSFAYSLDLLIPVLTFPLTDSWVPSHTWGKIISVIAVLAGWLLVPLFIAAWTGLIRPRNQ